jgi:hypothetical protein
MNLSRQFDSLLEHTAEALNLNNQWLLASSGLSPEQN